MLFAFFGLFVELMNDDGWDNWPRLLIVGALAMVIWVVAIHLLSSMSQAIIDDAQINLTTRKITVPWTEVESIKLTWSGLYKVTTEEGTFYFPPRKAGFPLFLAANDEFDELIERKKRQYKL